MQNISSNNENIHFNQQILRAKEKFNHSTTFLSSKIEEEIASLSKQLNSAELSTEKKDHIHKKIQTLRAGSEKRLEELKKKYEAQIESITQIKKDANLTFAKKYKLITKNIFEAFEKTQEKELKKLLFSSYKIERMISND